MRAKPSPRLSFSHLLPFDPVVGSRILPSSPLRPTPPGVPPNHPNPAATTATSTATAATATPTTATATTHVSTPGAPQRPLSTGRGWRYFSRGEQQRGDRSRQHLPLVVYSGAYFGEEDQVTMSMSSGGRPGQWPARPATAPSGATTGVAMAMGVMAPTGRGGTAPGYSTATPDQGYGGGGGVGVDQYPPQHEGWDCFIGEPFAVAAGVAVYRRQKHLQQYQQHQRRQPAGPPRHRDADFREQNNHDPFLVCRGWRKASKNHGNEVDAPSPQAEAELAWSSTGEALSSPSPEKTSPGSFGLSCRPLEPETLLPRNMFLTRTHRRGGDGLAPPA